MLQALPLIDLNTIFSNALGGVIALIIAVAVSYAEFNRQAEQRRNNWYRSIHNTCVRIGGGRNVNLRGADEAKLREISRMYTAFSEQIQDSLTEAPEEVGLELFNSLQNIESLCIRYDIEASSADMSKLCLQRRHEDIMQYSRIVRFIIEHELDPDIEYLDELEDEELEEAKHDYEAYVNGTLYDDQNEYVKQVVQSF